MCFLFSRERQLLVQAGQFSGPSSVRRTRSESRGLVLGHSEATLTSGDHGFASHDGNTKCYPSVDSAEGTLSVSAVGSDSEKLP